MTKQQATAEMKYRLSIYILQVLLDSGDISTEEAMARPAIVMVCIEMCFCRMGRISIVSHLSFS